MPIPGERNNRILNISENPAQFRAFAKKENIFFADRVKSSRGTISAEVIENEGYNMLAKELLKILKDQLEHIKNITDEGMIIESGDEEIGVMDFEGADPAVIFVLAEKLKQAA
jgi:hypothetical protein